MNNYDNLFKGQIEAVLSEFNNIMVYYTTEIDNATERIETLLLDGCLGDDGTVDMKKKKIRDYNILAERKNVGYIMDKKVKLLIDMGQFAKNDDRWDAEEALSISIQAFLRVAKGSITPTQYKRLENAIDVTLVNRTVSELKDFVNDKKE